MDTKRIGFQKAAKKAAAVALVGVLSVSCLAGCSSTKKQQNAKAPASQSQQDNSGSNKKANNKGTGIQPTNNNQPTKNNPLNKNGKIDRKAAALAAERKANDGKS